MTQNTEVRKKEETKSNLNTHITIRTTRNIETREQFKDYTYMDSIRSRIDFDNPMVYFGRQREGLVLITVSGSDAEGHIWWLRLNDITGGYNLESRSFGRLAEHPSSYTPERLERWQNEAIRKHNNILREIESHYWEGREIPRGILNLA